MRGWNKIALRVFAVSMAAVLPARALLAQGGDKDPIAVSFVSSTADAGPGGTMKVGALFEIAPGWHLYWKNPGDSGLPTEVSFTSHPEIRIGEVMFPLPERFELPGGITGNGYEGSALVFTELELPEGTAEKTVTATLKWLGCSAKLCVPGRATKTLELGAVPVASERFGDFDDQYPVLASSAASPLAAKLSGALSPEPSSVSELRLIFDWKSEKESGKHELFVVPPKGYSVESATLEAGKPPSSATVRLRAENPRIGSPAPLEFLLVGDDGERRGVQGRFTLALGERYATKEVDR